MKPAIVFALLIAAAPVSLACESFVPDMEKAALAVSSGLAEQAAIRHSHDEARLAYDDLIWDIEEFGTWDGWENDAEAAEQVVEAAAAAWEERTPFWDAADAELLTAIEAHEAACGPDRRTRELLVRHRISLPR